MKITQQRATQRAFVSLKLWAAVGISCVLFVLVTYGAFQIYYKKAASYFLEQNRERLDSFFELATDGGQTKRVAAIGTSLLHRGVYRDEVMNAYWSELATERTKFLRIAAGGGRFPLYEKILEYLTEKKIDLILVQTDPIVKRHRPRVSYSGFLRTWPRAFLATPSESFNMNKWFVRNLVKDRLKTHTIQSKARKTYHRKNSHDGNLPSLQNFTHFAKLAQQEGIEIALLHIPRSPLAGQTLLKGHTNLITHCKAKLNVTTFRYPETMGNEYYYNRGHMNEAGRQRYSRWLGKAILNHLNGKSD